MRNRVLSLIFIVFLVGCGPKLARQELGEVVFEVPKVAGADKPRKILNLEKKAGGDASENRSGQGPEKR